TFPNLHCPSFRSQLSPISTLGLEFAHTPANMAAIMAGRGQGLEQDFDFFVVVDFEPTCVKDARIFPQEIIEFPAVLVDGATGRIESAFRRWAL
uniref:Exonuclease domain-containing protein n=1 Tax=Aegilops tauschii subsp. strangulata TaxID=200361 RepID=A0A453EKJ6_AEGTS